MRNTFFVFIALICGLSGYGQEYKAIITRKEPVIDTFYNNYIIEDDYRWMEQVNTDEMHQWIKKENRQSKKYLARLKNRSKLWDEIDKYRKYEAKTFVEHIPKYQFRMIFNDEAGSAMLQIKLADDPDRAFRTEDPSRHAYRTLVDPNEISNTDFINITGYWVSENEDYLAYQYNRNGSDKHEVKIITLPEGRELPDHLDNIMFSNLLWYKNGFFYSSYESKNDFGITTNQKVYYHQLGTGQFADTLVFMRPRFPDNEYSYRLTKDKRFFILKEKYVDREKYNIFYFNLKTDHFRVKPLLINLKNDIEIFAYRDGKFLGYSGLLTGNGMIVEVDAANPMKWKALTPPFSEAVLTQAKFLPDKIVAIYQTAKQPVLTVLSYSGVVLSTLKMPLGTKGNLGDFDKVNDEFYFSYESFIVPPITNRINLSTYEVEPYKKTKVHFDFSNLAIEQVEYPSNDSVMVPMTLVYKKDIRRDGRNPALLKAYGGFGVVSLPHFDPGVVAFVEHGGVYAFAYIRGGGEKGKKWAEAGRGLHKQQSFSDFIEAAEYLIKEKYTRPDKLAIYGASNGGLVVAAAAMQRPDLFRVVIPRVAPFDMLRFEKFTVGHIWKDEYGSVSDSAGFVNLLHYSPYANIKKGINYPTMLIITSDNDDRVPPFHSYKFAARMQSRPLQLNPVLLKVEKQAGHYGNQTYRGMWKSIIDLYSFVLGSLN